MGEKEPVVLAVLVEAAKLRWFVAKVGRDGAVTPLVRSADDDLALCRELSFDEQVSFLRHRLCGVLQRGCDRLWPVAQKAGLFAVLFDGDVPGTTPELTRRVADHFVEWLLTPPVVVFTRGACGEAWNRLAGGGDAADEGRLTAALARLRDLVADPDAWEVSTRKGTWQPESAT